MSTHVYNADDVILTFGPLSIENLGEGDDAIVVEYESDHASDRVGVGGSVVVSQNQDRRGTITVKVLRTARENGVLQQMKNRFDAEGTMFPVQVSDTRGTELHGGAKAYIMAQPRSAHGSSASDVEWRIRVTEMRSNQGGYIG